MARLCHQIFVGLGALNQAIKALLIILKQQPFKKLTGCRQSAFETFNKLALRTLLLVAYDYKH